VRKEGECVTIWRMITLLLANLIGGATLLLAGFWRGRRVECEIWVRHWPCFPYDEEGREISESADCERKVSA